MRQQTLADEGFERYRKRTRREQFLDEMDKIVPWKGLCEVIEPFYPKPEGAGRPPIGLQRTLYVLPPRRLSSTGAWSEPTTVNRRRLLTHHQHPTLTRSRLMYCIDCEDINLKICGSIFDAGYSPKWVILACLFTAKPYISVKMRPLPLISPTARSSLSKHDSFPESCRPNVEPAVP